ncbi:MAG: phosphodiesterase [Pseudomonadota bacterium]|jgi:3',5'-cyclic AMP phosphodiesterase CpdA|nr:phosphodiesterase [Pseudomonadota bacterium]
MTKQAVLEARTVRLVQITDTHVREEGRLAYRKVDTAAGLRVIIDSVLALRQPPDAVVVTGDLVDFGRPTEYARLRELLAPLAMPVYLMPGNHDDREQLRAAFPEHGWLAPSLRLADGAAPIQYAVRIGPLHLVTLDTVVPGKAHGELCDARLDWLEERLAERQGEPVIVAMHHPPFTTLIGHMDKIGLKSGIERLARIVAQHPNVERVICGHLHRAIDVRFGGTIASTCPGPAHQVTLDLDPDAKSSFMMEPPGFRVHAWTPRTGVVTHLAPSGRFEGPYPFHEDGGGLID